MKGFLSYFSCVLLNLYDLCTLVLRQDEEEGEEEEAEEKITRNWSILKTTPQPHKSKVPAELMTIVI